MKDLFLFGAGYYGRIALRVLKHIGMSERIYGYIDSNKDKQGTFIDGVEVYSPEIIHKNRDSSVFITVSGQYANEIAQECINAEIKEYFFFDEIAYYQFGQYRLNMDKYWEKHRRTNTKIKSEILKALSDQFLVDYFVLSVGQACSLKCKYCGNFAPYVPTKKLHYSLKDIESDIDAFFSNVDFCFVLQIQGGEPFLYKELAELMNYLKTVKKLGGICIATNGKHMPNDVFWQTVKNMNVSIRISNYPNYSAQLTRDICKSHGVDASIYRFTQGLDKWKNLGDKKSVYELQQGNSLEDRFRNCPFMSCLTMEDGIIARCSRAQNAAEIQGFEHKKGDIVNIRDSENKGEEFKEYYMHPKAMTACMYCLGGEGQDIPVAEQL